MEMKYHKYILISAAVLALASCRNYLNVQPQGKVIPTTDEEFAAIIDNHINEIDRQYGSHSKI